MKLASYSHKGRESFGIVRGAGVFDLGSRLQGKASDTVQFIANGLTGEAAKMAQGAPDDFALSDIRFMLPVAKPILCIGVNYKSRPDEVPGGGYSWNYPSLFWRTSSAHAAHLSPVLRPPESTNFDYEGRDRHHHRQGWPPHCKRKCARTHIWIFLLQ